MRPADQEQGYSPELELHPECQSACRCREPTPDEGQTALSGRPADRYEAWMIAPGTTSWSYVNAYATQQ